MMGEITIGDKPASEWTDGALVDWLKQFGDNKPRGDTLALWASVIRSFDDIGVPVTVRQMFYALTTRGAIDKTEKCYKQVAYRLLQMRRLGIIPYSFLADNTRWMRKTKSYNSLADFLAISQKTYRHSLWAEQDTCVEIWIEKDALAGVVSDVTSKWDVPLMVTRGFPSETFVYEAAENIKGNGKPAFLYYFGDYDPSGMAISDNLGDKLKRWKVDAQFERVAVTEGQIAEYSLPTRPTKIKDTRSKKWRGDSVELDAFRPAVLRQMVENCITRHINASEYERIERIEKAERDTLSSVMTAF